MKDTQGYPRFLLGFVLDIFETTREEQIELAMHSRDVMHELRGVLGQRSDYFEGERYSSVGLTIIWSDFLQLNPERSRITRQRELPLRLYVPLSSLREIIDAGEYRDCIRWLCLHALRAARKTPRGDASWLDNELTYLAPPRFAALQ